MGALYRIVQDDHPPIPESVSAVRTREMNRKKWFAFAGGRRVHVGPWMVKRGGKSTP
jgi:hypothetical protein